jgi:hypothetical protein
MTGRTLTDIMAAARAQQPDHLKPELGADVDRAAHTLRMARAAERVAAAELAVAVQAAVDAGMPIRQAAHRAGVTRHTVYAWTRRDR